MDGAGRLAARQDRSPRFHPPGAVPPRTRFRHDRDNRLPHDVVVVDEASMVSLTMMARLLEALRPDARLVLVGDPDQLASVEAGAVLDDDAGAGADAAAVGEVAYELCSRAVLTLRSASQLLAELHRVVDVARAQHVAHLFPRGRLRAAACGVLAGVVDRRRQGGDGAFCLRDAFAQHVEFAG